MLECKSSIICTTVQKKVWIYFWEQRPQGSRPCVAFCVSRSDDSHKNLQRTEDKATAQDSLNHPCQDHVEEGKWKQKYKVVLTPSSQTLPTVSSAVAWLRKEYSIAPSLPLLYEDPFSRPLTPSLSTADNSPEVISAFKASFQDRSRIAVAEEVVQEGLEIKVYQQEGWTRTEAKDFHVQTAH